MKRINSLSDLLIEELADLLNSENQLIEALPKMSKASESTDLRLVLNNHLEMTKKQANRLQEIFSNIGQNPYGATCMAMKDLVRESEDVANNADIGQTRDVAIISMMQRVEQYEIWVYKAACEHAADLGHTKIVESLNDTINEERTMNLHLSEIAQGLINAQATDTKGSGFYVPEGNFDRGGIKKKNKGNDVSRFINEGNPPKRGDVDV